MNYEILSLETTEELVKLRKENLELSAMITKFDRKLEEQFNLMKEVYKYLNLNEIDKAKEILKRQLYISQVVSNKFNEKV